MTSHPIPIIRAYLRASQANNCVEYNELVSNYYLVANFATQKFHQDRCLRIAKQNRAAARDARKYIKTIKDHMIMMDNLYVSYADAEDFLDNINDFNDCKNDVHVSAFDTGEDLIYLCISINIKARIAFRMRFSEYLE